MMDVASMFVTVEEAKLKAGIGKSAISVGHVLRSVAVIGSQRSPY